MRPGGGGGSEIIVSSWRMKLFLVGLSLSSAKNKRFVGAKRRKVPKNRKKKM